MKIVHSLIILVFYISLANKVNAQEESGISIDFKTLDFLIITAVHNSTNLDLQQIALEATEFEQKIENSSHLGLFNISGNLNEYSIRELSGDNSIPNFYPRYNVGVNIKLNHFTETKNRKNLLEQNKKAIIKNSEQIQRLLSEQVTKAYIDYLKQKKILTISTKLEQFSVADFNSIEQKFSEGEIELNEYNDARKDLLKVEVNLINAEAAYYTKKTILETLVGESLGKLGIE